MAHTLYELIVLGQSFIWLAEYFCHMSTQLVKELAGTSKEC